MTKLQSVTSKPHLKRKKGFPLNSLSIEIKTGQYYMDMDEKDYSEENRMAKGLRDFFRRSVLR
ncbi:MAG: hypothetical protein GX053_11860 [Tissierella sp.]|nr:hypothetical protein [Tissierella sp.]